MKINLNTLNTKEMKSLAPVDMEKESSKEKFFPISKCAMEHNLSFINIVPFP